MNTYLHSHVYVLRNVNGVAEIFACEWDMKRVAFEVKDKLCIHVSVYLLMNCTFYLDSFQQRHFSASSVSSHTIFLQLFLFDRHH